MPTLQTVVLVVVVAGVLLLAFFLRRAKPEELPYFARGYLLSKGEHVFYQALRKALPPGLAVMMKVRLSDVINCSGAAWKAGYGSRISQKHLDFVLIDATSTAVRLVVELDDRTHQRKDRRLRDEFVDRALGTAGVPVLHVPAAASYDPVRVKAAVVELLTDRENGVGRRAG